MSACLAEVGVPNCAICRGDDFVTRAGSERAEATVCTHLAQCPTCRGSGYLRTRDAGGYEVMAPCARGRLMRRINRFNEMALPARFHDVTLGGYQAGGAQSNQRQMRATVEALRDRLIDAKRGDESLEPGVRGLGLSGAPGVGKTHLLCALARELTLEHGIVVRYADFSSLLWDLKSRFEQGSGEAALLGPLIDADVLVLDEVGKGKATEWDISIIDALVAGRYNRRKTIVFATNYRFDDAPAVKDFGAARSAVQPGNDTRQPLEERVTKRVFSRLCEMCDLVTVIGPDQRKASLPDALRSAR